jgi:hypothetical protein
VGEALSIGPLVGIVASVILLGAWLRAALQRPRPRDAFALSFPRSVSAAEVTAALRSLTGLLPPWHQRFAGSPSVVLETLASPDGIEHRLLVDHRYAPYVTGQFRAAIPGLRIEPSQERAARRPTLAREFRIEGAGRLRVADTTALAAGVLGSLQPLRAHEQVTIQWVVAPAASLPGAARLRQVIAVLGPTEGAPPPNPRRKPDEPELHAAGRVGISAESPDRRRALAVQVLGSFHAAGTADASLRRRLVPSRIVAERIAHARPPALAAPATLYADELAALVGIPVDGPQLPGLSFVEARDLPPVPAVPSAGRVLGHAKGNPKRAVAVGVEESLKGLWVLAPTGTGKSTILENLICQDFAAGRGVIVIESKGDLIANLCGRIPANRLDDVIVFDPADAERPVGFNLLAGGDTAADLIVDHTVGQFKALYQSALGPRSEDLLRASLTTLSVDSRATLCDVPLLLTDDAFRRRLLGRIDDPVLESVWSWFDGLSGPARSEVIAPLMNKLRAFTLRRQLRRVIGQADSPLDLDRIVRSRSILLISLAKGSIGADAAALLGSAIISRLWQAVAGRVSIPAQSRTPLFIYCDEAQDFLRLPVAFGDAVAQSRGYGVGWTIANQHLAQLPPDLREACLANLRSKVILQTAAADARTLAREFAPHLDPSDLQGLGPFEGYAAVSTGAAVSPPASIVTQPPPPSTGSAAVVRQRSRERYGRDAQDVEAEFRARVEGSAPTAPIGRRRLP